MIKKLACCVLLVFACTAEASFSRVQVQHMLAQRFEQARTFSSVCKQKAMDFIIQKSLESQLEYASHQLVMGSAAVTFYAAALWWLKETLRDMGYGYIDIKREYLATKDKLRTYDYLGRSVVTEREAQIGAVIQALSRVPGVYWREIVASAITIGLFKTGYYFQGKLRA